MSKSTFYTLNTITTLRYMLKIDATEWHHYNIGIHGETTAWWLVLVTRLWDGERESSRRLQVEFPFSPFSLTSCPAAAAATAVHRLCLTIKHVWQGDSQVSKRLEWLKSSVQLRNFTNSSSPAHPQQKTGRHGGYFFYMPKRGSWRFYFSFYMSLPAFLQVI